MLLVLAVMAFVPVGGWAQETVTYYDLWIGDTQVTSENMANVLGDRTVSFEVSNDASGLSVYTLTLNGVQRKSNPQSGSENMSVLSGLDALTINLNGANTLDFICWENSNEETTEGTNDLGTLAFTGDGSLEISWSDGVISGFSSVNTGDFNLAYNLPGTMSFSYTSSDDGPTSYYANVNGDVVSKLLITKQTTYPIWVCQTIDKVPEYVQITEDNQSNVLNDNLRSVSYENSVLNLNGASLTSGSNYAFVMGSSITRLTVNLTGENTVSGNGFQFLSAAAAGTLTFITSADASGTFALTSNNYSFVSNGNVTAGNGLAYIENQQKVTKCYLTIGNNINVTETSRTIMGDNDFSVYFDASTNTLTLNNATISDTNVDMNINVFVPTLTVKLVGTNTLAGDIIFDTTDGSKLIFEAVGEDPSLTLRFILPEGLEVEYKDGLVYKDLNGKQATISQINYGITVNGIAVTSQNREDILSNSPGTVKFDGHSRLILNNASLTGITVDGANTLPETGLEIYLVGKENVVTGNIVSNVETHIIPLAFTTNEAAPGKLTIGPYATGANVFQGFTVKYLNNLKAVTNGADAATTTTVQTKLTLALVVDEENETVTTDYNSVIPNDEHKNVTIQGIMYTLNDNGNASDPDGFVDNDELVLKSTELVLNSTVNADQLNTAMNSDPGSDAFIAAFKGLTFLLPPGTGKVTLIGAYCDANHVGQEICVKFGNQEPVRIRLTTKKTDYVIPYAVEQSTYGYIYLPASSSGAPAMMATRVPDRRIGPKSSVAGGLGGLSIKSSSIDVPAAPAASYMMCSKDMMATQMASLSEGNAENGFSFGVSDITDLSDDVFRAGSASAPRRAAGYALPEKLTFIDLSETKIMGMEVSRTSGPFKDVPNNTFIYMPAGNTVAAGTKNVVIGSVCSDMELNGATGSTDLFKAKKSFTAAKATLKRSFTKDELATVCLPYSIMASDAAELGEFHTVTSVSSSAATLSSPVTGNLSASTAYVVKPSDNKTDLVAKSAVVSTDSPNGSTLVGVFKRTDYTSGNWYCYAGEEKGDIKVGQFVKMKDGAYVPPFRAYLVGEGSAPTLSLLWEGQDNDNNVTAVQQVKATGGQQAREGWWTLNGIRLNGQPAKAGMYVNNGRLVIVK